MRVESTQRRSYGVATGMTAALFAVQAALMGRWLTRLGGLAETAAFALLFALVYGGALAAVVRLERPGMRKLLFTGAFAAIAMLTRVAFLDYVTGDYDQFLVRWIDIFREGGAAMLAENVGDYNLLYQYVLLLIAKAPLCNLYLLKLFSVAFDFALAVAMGCAARQAAGERAFVPAFCAALVLPTALLNGACWGQCDSVYAFFVILCLLWLKDGHPAASAAALAVAFAFKLQTIFFFPVVLLALIHGEYKPRHALCFAAAYLVTLLPALMAGRTLVSALSVYANQAMGQYYDRLTYNAPNLYLFFPMMLFSNTQEYGWMRFIEGVDAQGGSVYLRDDWIPALQSAALYACIVLTLLVVVYWLLHAREITPQMTLGFALFFAIFLPFVMPKIHERYFFLADMLSLLYAFGRRDRRFVPVLVVASSMLSYFAFLTRQRPIDERWAALMMLAALLIVGRDLLWQMRENRALLRAKGGEAA